MEGVRLFDRVVSPGIVVSVPVRVYGILPVIHLGILHRRMGSDGQPTVCHNSHFHGAVVHTTLRAFLGGRDPKLLSVEGYPGPLEPEEVLERAMYRMGAKYSTRRYNCEHYVTESHGLPPHSPQMKSLLCQRSTDPWGFARFLPVSLPSRKDAWGR